MATELISYIVDPGDGEIHVSHTFWGKTRAEAETARRHHLASCEYFRAAVAEGRELQDALEIPESDLPIAEEDDGAPPRILEGEVLDAKDE